MSGAAAAILPIAVIASGQAETSTTVSNGTEPARTSVPTGTNTDAPPPPVLRVMRPRAGTAGRSGICR